MLELYNSMLYYSNIDVKPERLPHPYLTKDPAFKQDLSLRSLKV